MGSSSKAYNGERAKKTKVKMFKVSVKVTKIEMHTN